MTNGGVCVYIYEIKVVWIVYIQVHYKKITPERMNA